MEVKCKTSHQFKWGQSRLKTNISHRNQLCRLQQTGKYPTETGPTYILNIYVLEVYRCQWFEYLFGNRFTAGRSNIAPKSSSGLPKNIARGTTELLLSLKHELSLLCLWYIRPENRKYQDDTHPGDPGIFNSLLNIFKFNFLLNPNPLPWRLFCNCRKWSTDWTLVSFASKVFKLSDRNTEKGKGNFPAIPRIAQFSTGK